MSHLPLELTAMSIGEPNNRSCQSSSVGITAPQGRHVHNVCPFERMNEVAETRNINFSISIVSHHNGSDIALLLQDLRQCLPLYSEILLTINTPEDEGFLELSGDLPIRILRNVREMGFGANHNQAFAVAKGQYFIIVNPDIRLNESPFESLADVLFSNPTVGACAPMVLAPSGRIEDSFRRFPTLWRFAIRVLLRRRQPDYYWNAMKEPFAVDWVAGMFIAFSRTAFTEVGGFNTHYYMYLEDTDICQRLVCQGKKVVLVPKIQVVHNAQRASQRNLRHLRWHLRSVIRFLLHI